jgi:NTE family protein
MPEAPPWVAEGQGHRHYSSLNYQRAAQVGQYRDGEATKFIHLVDGGISDNLGARPIILENTFVPEDLSVASFIDPRVAQDVVIIMVNAANQPSSSWPQRNRPPLRLAILNRAISGLMSSNNASIFNALESRLTMAQQRVEDPAQLSLMQRALERYPGIEALHREINISLIEVGFDRIENEEERSYFKNIATSLALTTETFDLLINEGARLLREAPDYQKLVDRWEGSITPVHHEAP